MPGWSQRWPLTAFKQDPSSGWVAGLGWPAEQHVLLLAQQQVRQSWDTAEGEGTQEIRDGWWSLRNPEGRDSEHAVCRERGWEWGQEQGAAAGFGVAQACGAASITPVHLWAQAEPARRCFKWRQRVFSTFPCQEPHCWSSNVFSTQPSQLVLGRDLISNIVWNSISPVRRALTMELPCASWVMSTLIYCPWVLWKCLKIVTLPHCWALGLCTVIRQKVITGMGPIRGGEKAFKSSHGHPPLLLGLLKFMWTGTLLTTQQATIWQKKKKKSEIIKDKFLEHWRKRGEREEAYLIRDVGRIKKISQKNVRWPLLKCQIHLDCKKGG